MSQLVRRIEETAGIPCEVFVTGVADGSAAVNRNRGLEWAGDDEAICMVDDDISFTCVGWLVILAEALRRPEVVMVSSLLFRPSGKPAYMTGLSDCGGSHDGSGEWVVPTRRLLTACCAFKPHGLRFDERYVGSGHEDTDFCNQLAARRPDGLFVVCKESQVVHANEQKEQRSNFTANKILYFSKWEPEKLGEIPMKPLVALYKTYRGGEWFRSSLESVREGGCVGAVAVMTGEPWLGIAGTERRDCGGLPENCREPMRKFREAHPDFPVVEISLGGRHNSEVQYRVGLEVVRSSFGREVGVLVVDTDEVWDAHALMHLRAEMANSKADYFRSGIWTYLRSPLYRVAPQEKSRVVVGLRSPEVAVGESRFSGLRGKGEISDVPCSFHHFGYVRLDPEEIKVKLGHTASQDRDLPASGWKERVWDELPAGSNLHPVFGHEHCWPAVGNVKTALLPPQVTKDTTFWGGLAFHRDGAEELLIGDCPEWRRVTEAGEWLRTDVDDWLAVPLSAALTRITRNYVSLEEAAFLIPRLRMSFRETMQLAVLARKIRMGGWVVEIGSGLGGSMTVIGLATHDRGAHLTAVDPYVPYDEENAERWINLEVGTPSDFEETLLRFKIKSTLSLRSSEYEVERWNDGDADFVLVDGNHSYAHALQDLRKWWAKLKSGGMILVHDLSARFPGVVRAVREFEAETGAKFNLPTASSLAWVVKP